MQHNIGKAFERELPDGYRLAHHINAKKTKTAIVMNLVACAVLAVIFVAALILAYKIIPIGDGLAEAFFLSCVVYLITFIPYMISHELLHGVAYKLMTREKLKFGISWSCAFCGVPNIYVYRKASIIALAAPLVLLSLLLMPIAAVAFIIALEGGSVAATAVFLGLALLIGMHVGGCSGDIYLLLLFIFKFKKGSTLVRDTGPEQFIYVKVSDSVSDSASVRNSL